MWQAPILNCLWCPHQNDNNFKSLFDKLLDIEHGVHRTLSSCDSLQYFESVLQFYMKMDHMDDIEVHMHEYL
jgi:hypothetical protein